MCSLGAPYVGCKGLYVVVGSVTVGVLWAGLAPRPAGFQTLLQVEAASLWVQSGLDYMVQRVPRPKWTAELGLDLLSAWGPRRVPLPRADSISPWLDPQSPCGQPHCEAPVSGFSRVPLQGAGDPVPTTAVSPRLRAWVAAKVPCLQIASVG